MAKNIFVGGIPFTTSEDTVRDLFSQHGQVQSVNIIKDKYTGRSRGFAFVEMGTEEEAKEAMDKLNGFNLEGRNIIVKEALPKPDYQDRNSGGGGGGRRDFDNRRPRR